MKKVLQTVVSSMLLGCALAGAHGQDPEATDGAIPAGQLVLRYYTTRVLGDEELSNVAEELFGERILVASPDGNRYTPQRFLTLAGSILVRDTAERADAILLELAKIEDALYPPDDGSVPVQKSALESFEYAPRFLSCRAVLQALSGYQRKLVLPPPGEGRHQEVDNITVFPDGNRILVREAPEVLAEIRGLLASIDVPVPQASFTFMLIRARAEGASPGEEPPAELAQHLGRLLPARSFEVVATGLMRGSVRGRLSLRTGAGPDQYSLELEPAAFDPETRELTLERCAFQGEEATPEGEWETHHRFETAFSLAAGEYTVIGAVGSDPLFVVLRMEL